MTPSEPPGIPTIRELMEVPRWARVAFAARCARRVQPLFRVLWPAAPPSHSDAIEKAIRIVEGLAGVGALSSDTAVERATQAEAAARVTACYSGPAYAAADAADAAIYAARADQQDADAYAAARGAAEAATAACGAADGVGADAVAWRDSMVRAIRMDLERLRKAARKGRWTDGTPVPIGFFGTLWPEGSPRGWPSTTSEQGEPQKDEREFYEQPTIELYIDPGDASTKTIQEVLIALSDLHVAAGGLGLKFVNDGQFIYATERIER
jgi:hypothetical protein